MRPLLPLFALALSLPAAAGDTQAGATVNWGLTSELSGQTGTKKYG